MLQHICTCCELLFFTCLADNERLADNDSLYWEVSPGSRSTYFLYCCCVVVVAVAVVVVVCWCVFVCASLAPFARM